MMIMCQYIPNTARCLQRLSDLSCFNTPIKYNSIDLCAHSDHGGHGGNRGHGGHEYNGGHGGYGDNRGHVGHGGHEYNIGHGGHEGHGDNEDHEAVGAACRRHLRL